jgi:hypothetical protein
MSARVRTELRRLVALTQDKTAVGGRNLLAALPHGPRRPRDRCPWAEGRAFESILRKFLKCLKNISKGA